MHKGLIFALLVVLCSQPAFAQTKGQATPVDGQVHEGFDPSARVAGSRIVGVRIGAIQGMPFDPASVLVMGAASGKTICVRAISRDGLYWMRTPYLTKDAGERLELAPFTKSAERLRRYGRDEIAIFAFESPTANCLDEADVVLPVVESDDRDALFEVRVNSGNRRVTAQVKDDDEAADLSCVPPASGERITFDRICSAVLSALPAGSDTPVLWLTFDDGLSKLRQDYPLRLPGPLR